MHFDRQNVLKIHNIIYFFRHKRLKMYVCLPYLKFSDQLPEKQLWFIWP